MADERTPLLSVVETRPGRDRYPHHTLRFICTTVLSIILILGGAAAIVILVFFVPEAGSADVGSKITSRFQKAVLSGRM